jgi:hypothetical protein
VLLNGSCCCCCCCSTAGAGARAALLLLPAAGRAGPGRAVKLLNGSSNSRLRRRAVRGATGGAHICGARRVLPESIPSSAARHTCCSCALLAGCQVQRGVRAVRTQPTTHSARHALLQHLLACSAGSALGVRGAGYIQRAARAINIQSDFHSV